MGRVMPPETLTRTLLRAGLVVLLILLAWWLVDVLLLTFVGVLIAVVLRAPADWLSARTKMSPHLAIGLVLLTLVLALGGALWAIAPEVGRQFDQLLQQVPESMRALSTSLEHYRWGQWLLAHFESSGEMLARPETMQGAGRVLSTTFGAFASLFVVFVVGMWVTLQPRVYIDNTLRLFPVPSRPRVYSLMVECGRVLQRWMVGCMVSMLITGSLTWLGLWLLGVPLALVLALLVAVMVFVPNFGPILASIPAILLALTQSPQTALWVVALYVGVQIVDNTMLTPLIQRQAVSLPPALTMMAQTAMGVLAGGLGVIVAVPLTALALVVVRRTHVEPLEGTEPSLLPAE